MTKAVLVIEQQGNLLRIRGAGGSIRGIAPPSEETKRGLVSTYSSASKRRLGRLLATIEPRQKIIFMTLTYPKDFPTAMEAKEHLRSFLKRLKRIHRETVMVWRLEFQERGAPHFHIILTNFPFVPQETLKEMWCDVTKMDVKVLWVEMIKGDPQKAFAYLAKYASKPFGSFTFSAYLSANPSEKLGRVWGIWGKEFLQYSHYSAALIVWDVENMREFFRRIVEHLDALLNIEREYDPQQSVTYFFGKLDPYDFNNIFYGIVDEITPGLILDDLIHDKLYLDAGQYSMALNDVALVDAEPQIEYPF